LLDAKVLRYHYKYHDSYEKAEVKLEIAPHIYLVKSLQL